MTIVERIFITLEEKQLKASDLAKLLNVGTGQVSAWKKRNTDPPAKYLPQICKFLGVTYEYILTGKNENITTYSFEDAEWLLLIHKLPREVQLELRGELKGYIKHVEESLQKINTRENRWLNVEYGGYK